MTLYDLELTNSLGISRDLADLEANNG